MFARVRGRDMNNRWVVPHSLYLIPKLNCHINVEMCSRIKLVKHFYKYIYKGHDYVAFNLISEQSIQEIDEIRQFH